MDHQQDYAFFGVIFSFLGSFFIAMVLAKTFRFRKYTEAELKKAEAEGRLKDVREMAKKDLVHFEMNVTSKVAPYSTHFAVIGIILLFIGFMLQSLAVIVDSVAGFFVILLCGIIALVFFVWDDL